MAPAQRRAAFNNAVLAEPLRTLIGKVARHAYRVTDGDIAAARASGSVRTRSSRSSSVEGGTATRSLGPRR
jgi:hypothetical protein